MSAALVERPTTYRDYTPEYRAEVIALVKANNGNTLHVSNETGIPRQTLDYWIKHENRYAEFQPKKQLDLAAKYEANLHRLTDSIADHDLETASLQAKATAVGILTEKMLLLRGQPTSITANIDADNLGDFLRNSLSDVIDVTPDSE